MPADFNKCVTAGGNVRTIVVSKGKYMHVCYDAYGIHHGEVKTKVARKKTKK